VCMSVCVCVCERERERKKGNNSEISLNHTMFILMFQINLYANDEVNFSGIYYTYVNLMSDT